MSSTPVQCEAIQIPLEEPMSKKSTTMHPTSFRLTKEDRALLSALMKRTGNKPLAVIRRALRKLARSEGIRLKQ